MAKGAVVLVDFENVQSIDFRRLEPTCRLVVFAGGTQRKIPIEVAMGIQEMGGRARWERACGSGPNALDFHIAFELGRMAERGETGPVVVLSKDKGFDPLLSWISEKMGIEARRASEVGEAFPVSSPRASAISPKDHTVFSSELARAAAAEQVGLFADAVPSLPKRPAAKVATKSAEGAPAKVAATGEKGRTNGVACPPADFEKVREILAKQPNATRPRRRATLAKHVKAMFQPRVLGQPEVEALLAELFARTCVTEHGGAITYNL